MKENILGLKSVRLRLEMDFYLKTTTTTIRQFDLGFFELRLYQPHAISSQKPRARSQIVQQLLQACAHPRLVQFLKIAGQRGGVATVFRSLHPPASVFDIIFLIFRIPPSSYLTTYRI